MSKKWQTLMDLEPRPRIPPWPGYLVRVVDGRPTITCLACGRSSTNTHDVAQRYCGACHVFHDDQQRLDETG